MTHPEIAYCINCGATLGPGLFCPACEQFIRGQRGVRAATIARRMGAYILDMVLVFLTLFIGYLVWALIAFQWGQTPGKQLLGIRSVRVDGRPLDWGATFIREAVVKWLLFGILVASATGGIGWLVDLLWAVWDKDRQTVHDKIMQTVVIENRDPARVPIVQA